MALWEYTIPNNNFNLDNYPPLSVSSYDDTFSEPIGFSVDISYTWHSTLYGTNHVRRVVMTGAITKYKQNSMGGLSQYPSVCLLIAGTVYGNQRCGVRVCVSNCCEVTLFEGFYIDDGIQTALNEAIYNDIFSGDYTTNGKIVVNQCTLPITFSDCSQDESNYMAFGQTVYGVPELLQFITYSPLITNNKLLTKELCNEHIINFSGGETVPETKDYFYYGYAHNFTVDANGGVSENNEPVLYKGFRVKSTGRVSLYVIEGIDDGHLKLGINLADVDIAYYSYDGVTWQNVQGAPTTLPFNFVWRKWSREVGTFYCSGIDNKLYETNCYIFGNKDDSDDYNDGTDETGEKAINYGEVNPDNPFNPTGLEDDETTFGQVYTRAFFSQQYICSDGAIQEISNAMFDTSQGGITGIFEDIKKGLEMYGEGSGVINAVQSCMFYPFNLNEVFTSVMNQNYIYFGGYKFDLQNNTVNKILYPNGCIDFGSVKLERTFNSYRDYAPYQRLYVYLPYLAWYELDINKYLGKTIGVKYFIDTRTGLCMAVLTANGVMCDYMSGQIGVAMPITLTDYSAYASAQIRTLLGGGSNVIGSGGSMGSKITEGYKNFTGGLVEGGAVGLGVGLGMAGVGVAGAFQGAKTLYGLTQNNINNFNKTIGSGSTSMLNQYLPQEVCFMFEIQDADITPNELSLQGLPSNASGSVGSFTGYLEVDTVNLVCADATANEKAQIVSMLKSGVYI